MDRHSLLVHYRPGSNKLTNENSYARLTDRERSVLASDRAMYPLLCGDRVRGRGYSERSWQETEIGCWCSDFEESG